MCCDLIKEIFSSFVDLYFSLSNRKIAIVGYTACIKSCRFTRVTKQFALHPIPGNMRRDAITLSFSSERTEFLNKRYLSNLKIDYEDKKEEKSLKVLTENSIFRASIIPTLKYELPCYSLSISKECY